MPNTVPSLKERPSVHVSYHQQYRPHHGVIADLVSDYAPEGGRVLDIGVGVGHMLFAVKERRPDLVLDGADIDSECLRLADARVGLRRQHLISDPLDLVEEVEEIDVIVMSHVLEHLRCPLDTLLGLVAKLDQQASLIVAVPNPVRPDVIVGNMFRYDYVNRGHIYSWDRAHWQNFLERIAKVNVKRYSEDVLRIPGISRLPGGMWLQKSLARIFPWFAFSNIAVIGRSNSM